MDSPKQALDKVKSYSGNAKMSPRLIKTKASINAGVVGLLIGAMVGHYKGYNVYLSSLVAATILVLGVNLLVKEPEE